VDNLFSLLLPFRLVDRPVVARREKLAAMRARVE